MAGHDLSIDMEALRALAADLKTIQDEFEGADNRSEEAADATGHGDLRGKVQDFADKWRIKREGMVENIAALQGIIQQVADTFTEVDAELARALEEKASDANADRAPKGYRSV